MLMQILDDIQMAKECCIVHCSRCASLIPMFMQKSNDLETELCRIADEFTCRKRNSAVIVDPFDHIKILYAYSHQHNFSIAAFV